MKSKLSQEKEYYALEEVIELLLLKCTKMQAEQLLIYRGILKAPGVPNSKFKERIQAVHFDEVELEYCYLIDKKGFKLMDNVLAELKFKIPVEFEGATKGMLLSGWTPIHLFKHKCGARIRTDLFMSFLAREGIISVKMEKGKYEDSHFKTFIHKDEKGKVDKWLMLVNEDGQRLIQNSYDTNFESWINEQLNSANNG